VFASELLRAGSQPGRGCIGIFENARRTVQLTFGVNPYGSSRPFLAVAEHWRCSLPFVS